MAAGDITGIVTAIAAVIGLLAAIVVVLVPAVIVGVVVLPVLALPVPLSEILFNYSIPTAPAHFSRT
jgi:hypothetical protein